MSDSEHEVELSSVQQEDNSEEEEPDLPAHPRQRPSRKAKQKVEEQRQALQKSKKGSKTNVYYDPSSDEESVQEDSEDEGGSDKDDSDADPVWTPYENQEKDADDIVEPRHKPGRPPTFPRKRRASRVETFPNASVTKEVAAAAIQIFQPRPPEIKVRRVMVNPQGPESTPPVQPDVEYDSDDNSPHGYRTGDFIMMKKELWNTTQLFNVWRIVGSDGSIQKFVPVISEKKLYHKSSDTFMKWDADMKPKFVGIEAILLSSIKGQDVITVLTKYRPQPPPDSLEQDAWMEDFNVFLQTLLSESLEPGFLATVYSGEYDHYSKPLEAMSRHIEQVKIVIRGIANFTKEFQEALETYPFLQIVKKTGLSEEHIEESCPHLCQAATYKEVTPLKAVKEAILYGKPYDRVTLKDRTEVEVLRREPKRFYMEPLPASYARQYHRLHHLQKRFYIKCCYMGDCIKENGDQVEMLQMIDSCLQNRDWVKYLFSEFKTLCDVIQPSPKLSSNPSSEDQPTKPQVVIVTPPSP